MESLKTVSLMLYELKNSTCHFSRWRGMVSIKGNHRNRHLQEDLIKSTVFVS